MIKLTDKYHCTGCSACFNICPKQAISMKTDIEGFLQPSIDQEKCIECGLCVKHCPIINPIDTQCLKQEVYAVISKKDRKVSSSGGAFSVFAKLVLSKGGCIYGATINEKYYTLEEIRKTKDLPYDTYIAGSDQIWNYMHTDFLDVFFLEFAKKFNAKRISYAASISVPKIPDDMKKTYQYLTDNIQYLSVRELQGAQLLKEICGKEAKVVLDPTFLLDKAEWMNSVGQNPLKNERYILVYTLSGSKYIKQLAKNIAHNIKCNKIVFIISNKSFIYENNIEKQIIVSPTEWVGLMSEATYVVTDSFHGTAFSINFNRPFTTLVNPVSNMNTRVMSILEITQLKDRIIFDDGSNNMPSSLHIDFSNVNKIIQEWKYNSIQFLQKALA